MTKLYTDLPEHFNAVYINKLINKINETEGDVELGWMSYGGSFWAGQTFVEFLNNAKKENRKINANATGLIASFGAVALPFFNHVKIANQADVMVHSVGGSDRNIDESNTFIYEAIAKKVDGAKFKEVTGKDLKEVLMAKGEDRVDVWFTGKDAVYMGLADEGYDLLGKRNSLEKPLLRELDYSIPSHIAEKYNEHKEIKNNHKENDIMDIEQFKKENAAAYASIVEEGAKAERKRVSTIMKYASFDAEKSASLIDSGKEISLEEVAELSTKKANLEKVASLEEGSTDDFTPAKPTKDKEKDEKEASLNELNDVLGLDF